MAIFDDVIILAAGLGTRMNSRRVKVLHEAAGRALIDYVIDVSRTISTTRPIIVVGHQRELVRAHCGESAEYVEQQVQLGTGHAVLQTTRVLRDRGAEGRTVLVLSGDVPLLHGATLSRLLDEHVARGAAASLLTTFLEDPAHYGRVIRREDGSIGAVIEARDASAEELKVREINGGVYAFDESFLVEALGELSTHNAQGEYYLTDLVEIAARRGLGVAGVTATDSIEVLGVNSRAELAIVDRELRRRRIAELQRSGVTFRDPDSTLVDSTVEIGPDSIIYPFVCLERGTVIGQDTVVESGSHLVHSVVGDGVLIRTGTVADGATIDDDCSVGPYAHLRPGTWLRRTVKIGNFVETKKATFGEGSKASHLSYVGDAEIGENVNIGAGTITCNYDGMKKHRTVIGDGVFIGSDSQLVAPVTIGAGSYVGAGSTITKDVPANALALSRAPQKTINGWAERRRARRNDPESEGGVL